MERALWPPAPGEAVRPGSLVLPALLSPELRYFFNKEGDFNNLTAAAYHKKIHLLVTGFASGIFHLHELPEFNLIHSLRWVPLLSGGHGLCTCRSEGLVAGTG